MKNSKFYDVCNTAVAATWLFTPVIAGSTFKNHKIIGSLSLIGWGLGTAGVCKILFERTKEKLAERIKTVIEKNPDAVTVVDRDGNTWTGVDALEKMLEAVIEKQDSEEEEDYDDPS